MTLRILQVMPSVDPILGGPSHAIFPLCQALQNCGVEITLLTTDAGVPTGQKDDTGTYYLNNVRTIVTAASSIRRREFIPSTEMLHWLWKNVSNYDLISLHYLFTFSTTCAGWLARFNSIPYVIRTIGHCAPWSLKQNRVMKKLYLGLSDLHLLKNAAGIHATSPGEARDIMQLVAHSNIEVIPLGVNIDSFHAEVNIFKEYGINPSFPVILFMSRLHPKKRIELLFQALQALELPFHCVVAGTGDNGYVRSLKELANRLNISEKITFTGHVSGEFKQALLHQSQMFVLPSFAENYSLATAEAMGAGLPVIISSEVQIADFVRERSAGIVIEADILTLTEAIKTLLSDDGRRIEMGKLGQRFVQEELSWQAIALKLKDFYQNATGSH